MFYQSKIADREGKSAGYSIGFQCNLPINARVVDTRT